MRRGYTRREAIGTLASAAVKRAPERPDIVLVMADDMGFSDLGCYGSEIATPHLDGLAERGVRFTQFYNCARCCPTRASLLTGLYPHQAGIGYMEPGNRYNKAAQARGPLPAYQGFLHRRCVTLAEALGAAGYQTMMAGKWHVGAAEGQRPWERGFAKFYGILGGASNHFRPAKALWEDGRPVNPPEDFYSSDAFSARAAQLIREAERDRPLFLYLAFTAPHWPVQAPAADVARYRGNYRMGWDELRQRRFERQKRLGLFASDTRLSERHPASYPWAKADQDDMDLRMAVYAAMVERLDRGVGRVLESLRQTGREQNTLILFLSDNGACAEPYGINNKTPAGPAESNTGYLLPWANASNTPFRLFKHWVHEGGIATPLLARWPGRLDGGRIERARTGHVKDILATCLDAAGARYPEVFNGQRIQATEGRSLLRDQAGAIYWEHEGNRAVRDGRWKLVSYYNEIHEEMNRVGTGKRTGPWELYDLERDRTELTNLAGSEPTRVRRMAAMYQRWADRVGARDWEELMTAGGFG